MGVPPERFTEFSGGNPEEKEVIVMGLFEQFMCRFRKLPTPLLITAVLSRFIFGVGVGALTASRMKRANWNLISGLIMAAGVVLVAPAGVKVWKERLS